MRHRYPFDTLQWLRHKRLVEQAALVGESAVRTAQACREEARAEAERQSAERQIAELNEAEQVRLQDGLACAGELQVVGDWRKGVNAELELKAECERRARRAHVEQALAEAQARRELGTASNEAKILDTHRSDWQAERSAALERSEEEAAAEQWTASHYPARRG